MSERETVVQRAILDGLAALGVFAWRNNTQGVPIKGGWGKRKRAPKRGVPDILGILPGGRFLGIEVKREGGVASDWQLDFIREATEQGALVFVSADPDAALETVRRHMGMSK